MGAAVVVSLESPSQSIALCEVQRPFSADFLTGMRFEAGRSYVGNELATRLRDDKLRYPPLVATSPPKYPLNSVL